MSTPIASGLYDNSSRDGNDDTIDGAEVDANPLTLGQILDGTVETMLNQDTSVSDGLRIRVPEFTDISAAGGGIRTVARFRHDPSSGTVADNDGVELLFQGDDYGGTKKTYGELEVTFLDVSAGSEDSSIVLKVMKAGTSTAGFTVKVVNDIIVWQLGTIRLFEDTTNNFLRILVGSDPSAVTDGAAVMMG